MTTKNLVILGAVAAVLGGAAYFCNSGRQMKAPSVNGKPVLPAFDVSEVAKVEIGGTKKLTLAASDAGWTIETLYGYPADVTKIRENLLKLKDLTVGQSAKGQKIDPGTPVALKDAKGKTLAETTLGGQHMSKPKGQAAQFGGGGYPDGRYVKFGDGVVLVKETLDAFDGDPKKWCEARICSVPSADVKAVTYTKGGETVKLTRKDSTWTLEGLGAKEDLPGRHGRHRRLATFGRVFRRGFRRRFGRTLRRFLRPRTGSHGHRERQTRDLHGRNRFHENPFFSCRSGYFTLFCGKRQL